MARGPGTRHPPDGPLLALPELARPASYWEALDAVTLPGPWAEFGVYTGRHMRKFLIPRAGHQRIYGFDWWKGLPTDWDCGDQKGPKDDGMRPKGTFACPVPKFLGPNVILVNGLFAETLPYFARGEPFGFMSLDADLYASTRDVLFLLDDRIAKGTVLRFDEFYGYENAYAHEQRAFNEWVDTFGRTVEWFTRGGGGAACILTN